MNLDLWLCETNDASAITWVADSDVSLPPLVTCRRITQATRAHSLASKILRDIERLTGETL